MYPVKKWLTPDEACSFLNMSTNHFRNFAAVNGLTVSELRVSGEKGRKYYRVCEIEKLLEENILIRKIN